MPDHEVLTKFYKESINKFKEVADALKQIGEYTNYKRKMRRPTCVERNMQYHIISVIIILVIVFIINNSYYAKT